MYLFTIIVQHFPFCYIDCMFNFIAYFLYFFIFYIFTFSTCFTFSPLFLPFYISYICLPSSPSFLFCTCLPLLYWFLIFTFYLLFSTSTPFLNIFKCLHLLPVASFTFSLHFYLLNLVLQLYLLICLICSPLY